LIPVLNYEQADSFCFTDSDCSDELSSHVWTSADTQGHAACNATTNACEMQHPRDNACGFKNCGEDETCCNPGASLCVKIGAACAP
jgi:hypothetical protein